MKRILFLHIILLSSLLAWSQQISIPWHCGFEEDETAELGQWELNPGTSGATDQWSIGRAVRSERKRSLYISTDGGQMASFGNRRNIIMAYRRINLPVQAKEYELSFDFRQPSNKGTLYVFFDYASDLLDGNDEYQILQYASINRADGIPPKVLDKARYVSTQMPSTNTSRTQEMKNAPGWRNVSIDRGVGSNYTERFTSTTSKRQLALVFVWINRNNVDTLGMGACIDNIQIAAARVPKPTNLQASYLCADSSITITWEGGLDGYMVGYRKSTSGSWRTNTYTGSSTQIKHSYTVTGLKDGTYDFRVCGWKRLYDEYTKTWTTDTTGYTTLSNYMLYCPENQCINFADLDHADCTYGPQGDFYKYHSRIDFGCEDMWSLHTVNTDQGAYDIRTQNKLKIIPDNSMVSVRVGNWRTPYDNAGNPGSSANEQIKGVTVTYDFVVDSAHSAILMLRYAMVFEESGHDRVNQPYFKLSVQDENNNLIDDLCGEQYFYCPFASDEDDDVAQQRILNEKWQVYKKEDFPVQNKELGFTSRNIWWKDWSTMGLNLAAYDGQHLRVVIESMGCGLSGHYGYGYFTLGCAGATIETDHCGDMPTATADAPAGFEYQWYAKKDTALFRQGLQKDPVDGHVIVVSHTDELTVKAGDTQTYICHLSYLDSPDCYFELETMLSPRNPLAMHTYSLSAEKCKNVLTLRDSSRVMNYGPTGDVIVSAEPCEYSQWSVRSLKTGERKNFSGSVFKYEAERDGDALEVTHTAYISGGECEDVIRDTIYMPDITTPDSLIYDTICDNQKYTFAGQKYNKKGVYYNSMLNRFGCDSVQILHLQVNPTSMRNRVDTICSTRLPYVFEGTYKGEYKRYEFTSDKNYITSDNYVIKLDNKYNCDSTINLELTIIPLLKAQVDSVPVLCSDGGGFSLGYQILEGDYDSLKISFSEAALKAGMRDTTIYHNPYATHVIPPKDYQVDFAYDETLLPDNYKMYVRFYQHPTCRYYRIDTIPLDIRYANTIIQQKWNHVLALLNEEYNANHCSFSHYQWYKGNEPIEGATKPYLYAEEGLDFNAEYRVLLTRANDSVQQFTCFYQPVRRALNNDDLYPTVAKAGSRIVSRLEVPAIVTFYTLTGAVYSTCSLPRGEASFVTPFTPGYYILSVQAEEGNVTRQKILITN